MVGGDDAALHRHRLITRRDLEGVAERQDPVARLRQRAKRDFEAREGAKLSFLPFFALVEIPWPGFVAFAVSDAAVWVAVSAFFLSFPPTGRGNLSTMAWILEALVYVRYAVLLLLLWMSRRAGENVLELPPPVSEPSAGLHPARVEFSS